MGKYEFPKNENFFWSILVTEATKMIARFLWFFSCLNFLDLKHEKNHVFFKNCKLEKLCRKHEKIYRNGTYLVPFCLFDFSANYHINFMKFEKFAFFYWNFFLHHSKFKISSKYFSFSKRKCFVPIATNLLHCRSKKVAEGNWYYLLLIYIILSLFK